MNRHESTFSIFLLCVIVANTGPEPARPYFIAVAITWLLKSIYYFVKIE